MSIIEDDFLKLLLHSDCRVDGYQWSNRGCSRYAYKSETVRVSTFHILQRAGPASNVFMKRAIDGKDFSIIEYSGAIPEDAMLCQRTPKSVLLDAQKSLPTRTPRDVYGEAVVTNGNFIVYIFILEIFRKLQFLGHFKGDLKFLILKLQQ